MIQKISTRKPLTLCKPNSEIVISNKNGLLYYHAYGNREINIPAGNWDIDTKYKLSQTMFAPYCKKPIFLDITEDIFFGNNPNKATNNMLNSNICVDKVYYKCEYLPLLPFLLLHEQGHNTVDNSKKDKEYQCDMMAIDYMLATGYNPSQINIIANVCLDNPKRKSFIHNYINHKLYKK